MKLMHTFSALAIFTLIAFPVIAHHPAADIVDEEIYAMIDIIAQVRELEDIIDDGLLSYTALLDGDVTLSIDFTTGKNVSLTIIQVEVPEESDKVFSDLETTTDRRPSLGLAAGIISKM